MTSVASAGDAARRRAPVAARVGVGRVGVGLAARAAVLAGAWAFAALERNPVVRLEAWLGLSPSPLEKLIGIRGPFSGMTEGVHQLARGDLHAALAANVLTPFAVAVFVGVVASGRRPRLRTRAQEAGFLGAAVLATVFVNVWHR